MISIEAHRASIGRFYNRLKPFGNTVKKVSTFTHNDIYIILLYLLLLSFLPILLYTMVLSFVFITLDLLCVKSIKFMHINHSCHYFALNESGFYNLSFLKLDQLLIDGDIESNPGPSHNPDGKSPGGRRKKIKGFKGTPKKCDFGKDIDFNVSYNVRDPSIPLGLVNQGENVCFFNSIMQVLYSLTTFRGFIKQLMPNNPAVLAIKNLFIEIESSNVPVRTSGYVQTIGIHDYLVGMQYDAHECLLQLLDKIYPVINDDCMFKVAMLETTVCEKNDCSHAINKEDTCIDWSLNIKDTSNLQTISGLLNEVMNPSGRRMLDYRCDRCHMMGSSTRAVCVTHLSDALIIQLNIFKFIDGISKKVIPALSIDEEISLWGNTLILSGIIYHEGERSDSGHYTSGVKTNDSWFLISDTVVLSQRKLACTQRDTSVPYILIYKKINVVSCLSNSFNVTSQSNPIRATTAVDTELTAEMMNRQSVLKELEKQKEKMTIAEEKKENDTNESSHSAALHNIKSPVKRKKKYSNTSSKKWVETFRDKLDDDEKNKIRNDDKKRKEGDA